MNRGIHKFSAVNHSLVSYHFFDKVACWPDISTNPLSGSIGLVTVLDAINKLDARLLFAQGL